MSITPALATALLMLAGPNPGGVFPAASPGQPSAFASVAGRGQPAPLVAEAWPAGPATDRLRGFLDALNAEGEVALRTFSLEQVAASALREKSADLRLADGLAMRVRLGRLTAYAVTRSGEHAVDVVVRSERLDTWLALHAEVEAVPPHGLLGVRGESVDPPFEIHVETPAFTHRHPRILFDEGHHETHRIDGTYADLAGALRDDGFAVERHAGPLDAAGIGGAAVLVIANALGADPAETDAVATARAAFTPAEIAAVRQRVEQGGSLLLLADHRPWGAAVQDLARAFGVDLGSNFTSDEEHSRGADPHHLVFTRETGLLGDHAILEGRGTSERVSRVVTFTGQSLAGPPQAARLLVLSPSSRDAETHDGPEARSAAGRAQGLALEAGRGRVVVLGESGFLRRAGLADPTCDDLQFVLNIFRWLARLDAGP